MVRQASTRLQLLLLTRLDEAAMPWRGGKEAEAQWIRLEPRIGQSRGDPRRSSILAPLHLPSLPILPYNDAAMLAVVIRADHSFLFPLSSFPSCLLSSTRIFSMVAYENKM